MTCVEGWCAATDGGSEIDAGTDAASGDGGVDGGLDGGGLDGGGLDGGGLDGGGLDAGFDSGLDGGTSDAGVDAGPAPGPCGTEPCTGWVLGSGSPSWEPFRAGGGPFAPTTPVRAAFDIQPLGIAYLLTDATYHVLRLSDRTFTSAGTRSVLFPEAGGVAIRFAMSIPPSGTRTQEIVFMSSADVTNVYDFDGSTRTFVHTAQVLTADLSGEWLTPNAPSHGNVIASWWAYENTHGWIRGAADTCDPVTVHRVFVTPSLVHPRSTAYSDCSLFLAPVRFAVFPPFALPQAPTAPDVGGAFYWSDELWVVAP